MARPIWTGSLGFGLVNVPIALYAATEDHGVHFHQLEEGTADRIRYRRVNERTGEEVPRDRIVRGLDVGEGEYVVVEDEELDAIAPQRSSAIEITDFVDLPQIDPVYYDSTYYLAPRGEAASRAYALLRAAMEQTRKVGIALFVMRGRERVVAVRPEQRALALETMYFADEVRDPKAEIPELPGDVELSERELKTACMLIDSLATEWDPTRYESTYRGALHDLIERKRHGETIRAAEEEPGRGGQIVDLMEALQASLEASKSSSKPAPRSAKHAKPAPRSAKHSKPAKSAPESATSESGAAPRARTAAQRERRAAATRRTTRSQNSAGGLADMTKADLQERAAELGISGRSRMTRDELEDAVRRATRRRAS